MKKYSYKEIRLPSSRLFHILCNDVQIIEINNQLSTEEKRELAKQLVNDLNKFECITEVLTLDGV